MSIDRISQLPEIERNRVLGTEQAATFIGLSVPHFRRLYRLGKVPRGILIGERKLGWKLGTLIDLVDARGSKEAA